jgi:nucleotide-binding universal stress UspA family protein
MASPSSSARIESIFHPSDFSEGSTVAFAHALKIALVPKAPLNILHGSESGEGQWADFPGVRQTLEQWQVLPPGSPRSAIPSLGIDVRKVLTQSDDPVAASLAYLERNPTDLVVLATHQHDGHVWWMAKAVAEPLARQSHLMTLFIPAGVQGFVSPFDGSVSLGRILIPIASDPSPEPAIDAACRAAAALETDPVTFTTLHVGDSNDGSAPVVEQGPQGTWNRVVRSGEPAETILSVAAEQRADLIVMTTKGRHGFLDALRGSTTERVLRHTHCPLLAIPVS